MLQHRYAHGASVDERLIHWQYNTNGSEAFRRFYHRDHQGSIIAMSDGTGAVVAGERYTYDAYGNQVEGQTLGQPFRYTGRRWDDETGLYYYRARYYSAELGRFLQTDPIGYEDNMNLYGYTANDPVNNTDPSGKILETVWDAASLAIGVASFVDNVSEGNVGAAIVDAVGIVADGVATLVPFVPGGAGTAIKAGRAADNAIDGARAADRTTDAARAGCCFVAGTQVLTKDGLKNIEDIKVGDLVWSRNPETGEQELKAVTDFIPRHERVIWELTVQNEAGQTETFETTDEHPWWVDGQGWKRTDELAFGMRVEDDEQRVLVVTSVRNTERKDGTYNLTVADFHTYFVGDLSVLVHNCDKVSNVTEKSNVGDVVKTPDTHPGEFTKKGKNYTQRKTKRVFQKSNTNHSGDPKGEFKVGTTRGQEPTKENKITITRSDCKVSKKDGC